MSSVLFAASVQAQPLTRAETLARVCFAEAGARITPDCAAINQVFVRGAIRRRMPYERYARLYSHEHFRTDRTDARAWLTGLRAHARQPARWPGAMRWSNYRAAWLALLAHAEALIAGAPFAECNQEPDHWGQPFGEDLARALRARWTRLACPGARNAFWRIPIRRAITAE